MKKEIKITRDHIYGLVASRMEWEGTRTPAKEADYSRVSLAESDRRLLHSLFDEAAMHAIDLCRPFLESASNTDDALTLKVAIPTGQNADNFSMALKKMLTSHVLALWQDIVTPDRASATFDRRNDYATKLLAILYHHPAPKRKS